MGSPCSGTVANLSLARREKKVIHRAGILAYTRYIDDVFALLETDSLSEVRRILQEVTEAVAPLEIKWNVSERHAIYLDVQVDCDRFGNNFSYRPFRKPGNQHAYLPWSSAHPIHVKKGLVMGETTRLSLLCLEELTFRKEVATFMECLLRRGYPDKALTAWMARIRWANRFGTIFDSRIERSTNDQVLRIPTTYNPLWENINLREFFDKVLEVWRHSWEPETRPSQLSLSQRRGESLYDNLSSWNKNVLGVAYGDADFLA